MVGARSLPAVAVVAGVGAARLGRDRKHRRRRLAARTPCSPRCCSRWWSSRRSPAKPPAAALAGLAALVGFAALAGGLDRLVAAAVARTRRRAADALLRGRARARRSRCAARPIGAVVAAAVAAERRAGASRRGAALAVRLGDPRPTFGDGRLAFPDRPTRTRAAAMFLVGFWPALVLAARRAAPLARARRRRWRRPRRCSPAWLMTQSKGGGIALARLGGRRARGLAGPAAAARARARSRPSLVGSQFAPPDGAVPRRRRRSAHAARDAGLDRALLTAAAAVAGAALRARRPAAASSRTAASRRRRGSRCVVVVARGGRRAGRLLRHGRPPGGWLGDKWGAFKHSPTHETAATHFCSLGSNRYDFWRVALHEFRDHPLAGIGDRGFGPAYLVERRSGETPARAHSFELDALSELGIVGFLLLLGGLGCRWSCSLAAARARGDLAATAGVRDGRVLPGPRLRRLDLDVPRGRPAVLPAARRGRRRGTTPRRCHAAPRPALASPLSRVAVLAFAPPWLSSRLSSHALEGSSSPASDLRWARRLDPLSVEPYLVQAKIAPTPAAALEPLRKAAAQGAALGGRPLRARRSRTPGAAPAPPHGASCALALRLEPGADPRSSEALKRVPTPPVGLRAWPARHWSPAAPGFIGSHLSRAAARRRLGGLRARRPLDRAARQHRAPARARATTTSSSTRCSRPRSSASSCTSATSSSTSRPRSACG